MTIVKIKSYSTVSANIYLEFYICFYCAPIRSNAPSCKQQVEFIYLKFYNRLMYIMLVCNLIDQSFINKIKVVKAIA